MAGGRQGVPGFDRHRLRSLREAAALTQGALAEAASVHVNEIVEWEGGRRVPQIEAVAALARALLVTPLDLVDRDEHEDLTLAHLRIATGYSQQQAANAAGLLRTTYSALERGETATLSLADAAALARSLHVDVDQIRTAHAASRAAHLARRSRGRARREAPSED